MNQNGPCLQTFGVTPPACLCLRGAGHDGLHVCCHCGAGWLHPGLPGGTEWPGPGNWEVRAKRLRVHYPDEPPLPLR